MLTRLERLFFKTPIRDFHCGLRAFRKDAIEVLGVRTLGMEFASETVVKATTFGLRGTEIPTMFSPDHRDRAPHPRTWRVGCRLLRFLLLYRPRWVLLYSEIVSTTRRAPCHLIPIPRRFGEWHASRAVLIMFKIDGCIKLVIVGRQIQGGDFVQEKQARGLLAYIQTPKEGPRFPLPTFPSSSSSFWGQN